MRPFEIHVLGHLLARWRGGHFTAWEAPRDVARTVLDLERAVAGRS